MSGKSNDRRYITSQRKFSQIKSDAGLRWPPLHKRKPPGRASADRSVNVAVAQPPDPGAWGFAA